MVAWKNGNVTSGENPLEVTGVAALKEYEDYPLNICRYIKMLKITEN